MKSAELPDHLAATPESVESERRGTTRAPCSLPIIVESVDVIAHTGWSGRSVDMSPRGICLRADRRFEPGTVLSLSVTGQVEFAPTTMLAVVAWAACLDNGEALLGCRFPLPISQEDFESLIQLTDSPGIRPACKETPGTTDRQTRLLRLRARLEAMAARRET
jgi:hypothetical protein